MIPPIGKMPWAARDDRPSTLSQSPWGICADTPVLTTQVSPGRMTCSLSVKMSIPLSVGLCFPGRVALLLWRWNPNVCVMCLILSVFLCRVVSIAYEC